MRRIAPPHVGYDYMNSCLIHDQTFTGCPDSVMGCTQKDGGKKITDLSVTEWGRGKLLKQLESLGAVGTLLKQGVNERRDSVCSGEAAA